MPVVCKLALRQTCEPLHATALGYRAYSQIFLMWHVCHIGMNIGQSRPMLFNVMPKLEPKSATWR